MENQTHTTPTLPTDEAALREDTLNRLLAQLIFLEKRLTPNNHDTTLNVKNLIPNN